MHLGYKYQVFTLNGYQSIDIYLSHVYYKLYFLRNKVKRCEKSVISNFNFIQFGNFRHFINKMLTSCFCTGRHFMQ